MLNLTLLLYKHVYACCISKYLWEEIKVKNWQSPARNQTQNTWVMLCH